MVSLWDVKYLLKVKLNKGKRLIDFVNDTHKSRALNRIRERYKRKKRCQSLWFFNTGN